MTAQSTDAPADDTAAAATAAERPSAMPAVTPNSLLRFFVRHANAANLLMGVLVALGLFSLVQLNRQFLPQADIPVVWISVPWPGASAEDVESNIIDVLEPELRFLDGVQKVVSTAREGRASVNLEFDPNADMSKGLSDVESTLARLNTLPEDAESPLAGRAEIFETVMSLAVSGPFSEAVLRDYAKDIRDRLLAAGVDRVTIRGMRDLEIRVETPQRELYRLDMTLGDIAARIQQLNQDLPAGVLEGGFERQLRSLGLASTAEDIAKLEIRAPQGGEKLLLRDIASVTEDFDREGLRLSRGGNTTIQLSIGRAATADTLTVAERADQVLDEVIPTLPESLRVERFQVESDFLVDRIQLLLKNGIGGLVLVLLVLFVFLDLRSTFWVAMGIPISLFATFAIMYFSGQSINMVSLFALIMTIGIIVDDAIVVGEHIVARNEAGESPVAAAENGVSRMYGPVTASILTTIVAFAPIFLVENVIGQIMSAIPLVVIAALAASMAECFLILPNHLSHGAPSRPRRWRQRFNAGFNWMRDHIVGPFSGLCFDWRYTTLATALASLILCVGLLMGGRVGFDFFPSPESEFIQANVILAPGASREDTLVALERVEESLHAAAEELAGDAPSPVFFTMLSVGSTLGGEDDSGIEGGNRGGLFVQLMPSETRDVRTIALIDAWRAALPQLPGVENIALQELLGGPPGRDIDVRFLDAPSERLKAAALDLRQRLSRFEGVSAIDDDFPYGRQELLLELTPLGTALGFTTEGVGRQLRHAFEGAIAKRFPRGDEEVLIRVSLPQDEDAPVDMRGMRLVSPSGERVLLEEVVSLREQAGLAQVKHHDGARAVSVTASVNAAVTSSGEILAELEQEDLPEIVARYGVSYALGGRAEEQADTFADLGTGAALAAAMIFMVLAWVSKSYGRPIVVMSIIPFGIVGAVIGHMVMGYKLTILSLTALMGLAGILVNDSIILVTHIDNLIASGYQLREAVVQGVKDRLRAMLLTSLTTIFGLLPLLFETSLQAQFLIPMAVSLVWGVGLASILVLVLAPSILGIQEDFKRIGVYIWRGPARRAPAG